MQSLLDYAVKFTPCIANPNPRYVEMAKGHQKLTNAYFQQKHDWKQSAIKLSNILDFTCVNTTQFKRPLLNMNKVDFYVPTTKIGGFKSI